MKPEEINSRIYDLTYDVESLFDAINDMMESLPKTEEGIEPLRKIRDTLAAAVARLEKASPAEVILRIERIRECGEETDVPEASGG